MLHFLYEVLKTAGILAIIASAVVCYMLLSGCSSIEGAGFSNTGKPSRPACVERDAKGNERWRSC